MVPCFMVNIMATPGNLSSWDNQVLKTWIGATLVGGMAIEGATHSNRVRRIASCDKVVGQRWEQFLSILG